MKSKHIINNVWDIDLSAWETLPLGIWEAEIIDWDIDLPDLFESQNLVFEIQLSIWELILSDFNIDLPDLGKLSLIN